MLIFGVAHSTDGLTNRLKSLPITLEVDRSDMIYSVKDKIKDKLYIPSCQ